MRYPLASACPIQNPFIFRHPMRNRLHRRRLKKVVPARPHLPPRIARGMQGDGSLGLPALRPLDGWCLREGDALTGEFYTEFLEQQRRQAAVAAKAPCAAAAASGADRSGLPSSTECGALSRPQRCSHFYQTSFLGQCPTFDGPLPSDGAWAPASGPRIARGTHGSY